MTEIPAVFERLKETYASGKTKPRKWREEQLAALVTMLREEEDAILEALAADVGKSAFEAFMAEIGMVVADAENTRKQLAKWMRPERISLPLAQGVGASAKVYHDSLGVALIIGAWNYPMMLTFQPLIGAIAGGNAAVIKPSELMPHSAAVIQRCIEQYLDTDAFAVVQGAIPETTELLKLPWDKIFFTGSTAVGKIVLRAAAENLVPCVLELGGKSPAFITKDANLPVAAARVAWGRYYNAGQTCIGVDYALVDESVYEEFIDLLKSKIHAFYGEDPITSPDYPRIVNDANMQRLVGLLEGHVIAAGGHHDPSQRYLAPTILRDVDVDSPVMQEEIFGPILPVIPYKRLDEAIKYVNSQDKPLAAYIFSESKATQSRILQNVTSGGACINDALTHSTVGDAPFGGVGASGMGSYHGLDGYLTFIHRRTVLNRSTGFDPALRYPPYSKLKRTIATKLV